MVVACIAQIAQFYFNTLKSWGDESAYHACLTSKWTTISGTYSLDTYRSTESQYSPQCLLHHVSPEQLYLYSRMRHAALSPMTPCNIHSFFLYFCSHIIDTICANTHIQPFCNDPCMVMRFKSIKDVSVLY